MWNKAVCRMHGLVVIEGMTQSGHPWIINEISMKLWIFHENNLYHSFKLISMSHDYQLNEFIFGLLIVLEINPINQTIILVDKVNKFNMYFQEKTTAMFK